MQAKEEILTEEQLTEEQAKIWIDYLNQAMQARKVLKELKSRKFVERRLENKFTQAKEEGLTREQACLQVQVWEKMCEKWSLNRVQTGIHSEEKHEGIVGWWLDGMVEIWIRNLMRNPKYIPEFITELEKQSTPVKACP